MGSNSLETEKNLLGEQKSLKITRRYFLGLVVGAFAFAAGGETNGFKIIGETEESQAEILKEKIQRKFGIKIATLREYYEEQGKVYDEKENSDIPQKWDIDRLKMLEEFLPLLPKHFCKSSDNGEKLWVVLSWRGSCCGQFEEEGYQHQVSLGYDIFKPEDPSTSFEQLTHELTHSIQPKTSIPADRVNELLEFDPQISEWSPWYDEIEEILGGKFYKIRKGILDEIRLKDEQYSQKAKTQKSPIPAGLLSEEDQEKYLFCLRLVYGLGYGEFKLQITPIEFIAILAEKYVHGLDYFSRMYGELFDQEKVEALYSFTKDEVFHGREYKYLPVG